MSTPSQGGVQDLPAPERRATGRKVFTLHALLIVTTTALLFFPAGTIRYWQGWVFLAFYLLPSLAVTQWLVVNDPKLLAGRMRGGPTAEKSLAQKIIMSIASICFVALVVVPALDHRFGWSHVPTAVVLLGDALIAIGWLAIFMVFRQNSFAFSTIQVVEGQQVVSSGLYAHVRHPMYAGAMPMLLGMPLALASWWGLLVFVPLVPVLIWRMLDEEKFLTANLSGYAGYMSKVRYRLAPGVW